MLLSTSLMVHAQITGDVSFDKYGIAFTIPPNWVGQELQEAFVMASAQDAGIMVLVPHPARSMNELSSKIGEGLNHENVQLTLQGSVQQLNQHVVEGIYEGSVNFQAVKGHVFGMLNPLGSGVAVISLVSPELYSVFTRDIGIEVVNSLRFSQAVADEGALTAEQCKLDLGGNKLVYMDNYYSADRSPNQSEVGGGYNLRKEINLCSSGYFTYHGNSFVAAGTQIHNAYESNRAQGHGTWQFIDQAGEVILLLSYHDGNSQTFTVEYAEDKTLLNGGRYYLDDVECY